MTQIFKLSFGEQKRSMQNRKPGWGWGSEKEGSFPFFQNGHSDGRNHKWEKDKEKKPPLYQAGTKWLAATQENKICPCQYPERCWLNF